MSGDVEHGAWKTLRSLAVGILLAVGVVRIAARLGARASSGHGRTAGDRGNEYRQELASYLVGLLLALMLTSIPFALVYWSAARHAWLIIAIGAFALLQVIVHFRFFLHIDLSVQKREDLQLILFSTLILTIMVSGTIWILADLAARMSL